MRCEHRRHPQVRGGARSRSIVWLLGHSTVARPLAVFHEILAKLSMRVLYVAPKDDASLQAP